MQRAWLVINPGSGSTAADSGAALAAALAGRGVTIAAETAVGKDALPGRGDLVEAACDTLVVMGGDGTINAATSGLDGWDGACLILPGGTMNLLPKALHGPADWEAIVEATARGGARRVRLPCALAGDRRALVGIIAGPVAAWFHARERWRSGRLWAAWRGALFAWRRTFSGHVRLKDRPGRHRAVVVTPHQRELEVAAFAARSWFEAVQLGWQWLAGDWRAAPGVDIATCAVTVVEGRGPVALLFDGELTRLPGPVTITHGHTELEFLSTLPEDVPVEPRRVVEAPAGDLAR